MPSTVLYDQSRQSREPNPVSPTNGTAQNRAGDPWRAPLLAFATASFVLMTVTGFGAFFLRGVVTHLESVAYLHTLLSLALLIPVAAYLARHLPRVWPFRSQFSGRLGIGGLVSFLLVTATGVMLFLYELGGNMRLAHTVLSFAFLVILSAHLAVVGYRSMKDSATLHSMLRRHLLWPMVLGMVIVAIALR